MSVQKPIIHLLTCGHVDSGKSTTFGHLFRDLGLIDNEEMQKAEREAEEVGRAVGASMVSFKFAFLMDEREDERKRGVTINIKRREFETKNYSFILVDAPGHRDFIKNWITGANIADAAVLFAPARPGEFETSVASSLESKERIPGQTREHAYLCKSFGVEKLVVAINKMDAVDYSEARFNEIRAKMQQLVRDAGFDPSGTQIVPISGLAGENLARPSERMPWYKGPSLVEALDSLKLTSAAALEALPLRIPVQKVEKVTGVGNVALGRVETGILRKGADVRVMPSGKGGYVRSVHMWKKELEAARPGDGIGFNIRGMEYPKDIREGSVVCSPSSPAKVVGPSDYFIGQIIVLDHPGTIRSKYEPMLFAHTVRAKCTVSALIEKLDPNTLQTIEKVPQFLRSGDVAKVMLVPAVPIVLERFQDFAPLGRFALRDLGRTVAAGKVLEIVNG